MSTDIVIQGQPLDMGLTMGGAEVSIRTCFSITHALTAALLVRECAALENAAQRIETAPMDRIRAFATAGVITSVAFLEATINEFFAEFVEGETPREWMTALSREQMALAGTLWESADLDRLPALQKYDVALKVFQQQPLDPGAQPYQDAALAVRIRNALIHAKPITVSDNPKRTTEISRKLSGQLRQKFTPTRFFENSAMFPDGTLGKGGAAWAFSSCLALTDEFFRRLGVVPRYELFRPRLSTTP